MHQRAMTQPATHQQCDVNYREIRRDRELFIGTRHLRRGYASICSPMKFVGPYSSSTNLAIVHITLLVALLERFEEVLLRLPLSSEYGAYKTVAARFWPCVPGKSPSHL